MKFYQISYVLSRLIPFEVYKDKVVVTTAISNAAGYVYYEISYDYKDYTNPYTKDIFFYDLTDEDLTHLKLLGACFINYYAIVNPELEAAITNKLLTFKTPRIPPVIRTP